VLDRRDRREAIFCDDADRPRFLNTLIVAASAPVGGPRNRADETTTII
jgi:hypothetical protein